MRFDSTIAAASLLTAVSAFTPATTSGTDALAAKGLLNLALYEVKNKALPHQCNVTSGYIRQEWSTLSTTQKTNYISAVQCLQKKPSQSGSFAPGAKNRYDDFVAVHINQTLSIHGTGNFLTWHRYFTWAYEQALRNECGYTGYQPYINWAKYSLDLLHAPLFDGSATSISGNGDYKSHPAAAVPGPATPFITIPPGVGGGCVTTGPFKNMSVNLGPLAPVLTDVAANPQANGLGYNPRCLRRDLSTFAASTNLQDANITNLITNYSDILSFQNRMQGDFANGFLGVHTAGHFLVGGDPGGDLFTSPGDPYFFLHHAQIDRTYWIWQNQNLAARQEAVGGTLTLNNQPPSRNTTLQDVIDIGTLADPIEIGDVMSTLNGPLCYIYA